MRSRGQGSVEWLLTHAWSIIVVLSVSAVLFYAGVFETTAHPRFEGLAASGVRPIPDQVKLYSDGVLVLTIGNMRPYSIRVEVVEVAPIADRDDVLATSLDVLLNTGDIAVLQVNGSNIVPAYLAGILFPSVSADSSYVDFHICITESHSGGGKPTTHKSCGIARRIEALDEPLNQLPSNPCDVHHACTCEGDGRTTCPLVCQLCNSGFCDNFWGCTACTMDSGFWCECQRTLANPEGECVQTSVPYTSGAPLQ